MSKEKRIIVILTILLFLSILINIVVLFGGTKLTGSNSMAGYWVYGDDVIHINKDNSFIWVSISDKSEDRYIIHYRTGIVDDNTLIFDKVYDVFSEKNRNNKTRYRYYKPEQIPETEFGDSTFSYVMNIKTNNVFVLSMGDHMTNYSFTRRKDYKLEYSDSEPKTWDEISIPNFKEELNKKKMAMTKERLKSSG